MYEYLTGQLIEKSPTSVVLDVQGTGYQITIPLSTYGKLPAVNQSVRFLIHFVVREDASLDLSAFSIAVWAFCLR